MDLESEGRTAAAPRLFIVHAAEDEPFVKGFLVPAVGLGKHEVLLSTKLELGATIVGEIARGSVSALTVVVMSPSLLASPWGRFANELATHLSLERGEGGPAVVPAMLADCEAPSYSRVRVVTASADNTARVWDVATGRALNVPLPHQAWVTHAAFSADGARVITASSDKTARVWEVATGRALTPPLEHDDEVYRAELSRDGARAVTASKDGTARIWEVAETGSLAAWSEHAQRCLAMQGEADSRGPSELAQRAGHFDDGLRRTAALLALGDQQTFSLVWAVPRATYQRALQLLDEDGGGDRSSAPGAVARRDELAMRLAVLEALEGDVAAARERLGAKDAVTDAALLAALGTAAHDELGNAPVAHALLRRARELTPGEASILTNLAAACFCSGELSAAARTVAELDLGSLGPELHVVLAAIAWATARLTQAPEYALAQQLVAAYQVLAEATRPPGPWKRLQHALSYGCLTAPASAAVREVLGLLEQEVAMEHREALRALVGAAASAPGG